MIKGTDGRESQAWLALVQFLLHLRAGKDVDETKVSFVQYMEVTRSVDEADWTSGCVSV